jgi:hypothetical protein
VKATGEEGKGNLNEMGGGVRQSPLERWYEGANEFGVFFLVFFMCANSENVELQKVNSRI